MASSAEVGTGTTITFASGFFAEVLSIAGPSGSRVSLQTSHMGTTTAHTFVPGDLVDWGEMTVEMHYVAGEDPPIDDVVESVTITFPDSASSTLSFDGFMTGFEITNTLEEIITASATIKATGDVTFA